MINTQDVNELLESLQCQICYKPFSDPRMLPCGHTFCQSCIAQSVIHGNLIQCPNNCLPVVKIAAAKLPQNYTLKKVLDSTRQIKQCVIHGTFIEFVDIGDGKLLCAECVRAEPRDFPVVPPAGEKISALFPKVIPVSLGKDILKAILGDLTSQSTLLLEALNSRKLQFHDKIKKVEEMRRNTIRDIDNICRPIRLALEEHESRLQKIANNIFLDITDNARHHMDSLSLVSINLQTILTQATETLESQEPAAQSESFNFLTSAAKLTSSLPEALSAAQHSLSLPSISSPTEPITVTCPQLVFVLEELSSPDFIVIDIPEIQSNAGKATVQSNAEKQRLKAKRKRSKVTGQYRKGDDSYLDIYQL